MMILRKTLLFVIGIFCTLSLSALAWSNGLNVKDFGAKGDGVTDDTAAIQKALRFYTDNYDRQLLAKQPMADDLPEFANHRAFSTTGENVTMPEIFFPAGRYIVSNTLVAGDMFLRGEEGSVIVMTDPEKDILYGNRSYRVRIEDLAFEGGKRQVLIYTFNEDMSYVMLGNCSFRNSSAYAVWCHNYRNPEGRDYRTATFGPYSVEWDGDTPILTPGDETLPYYYNSTLIGITDCSFENCQGVLDSVADGLNVQNCVWIMADDFSGPALKTGGSGHFVNCYGFAPAGGDDKVWYDLSGGLVVVEGGTYACGGDGMSLVNWNAGKRGEIYSSLAIRNADIACGGFPLISVDNSDTENTPNLLEVSYCREISGVNSDVLAWSQPFDFERAKETFFDFSWAIEHLDGSYSADFPFFVSIFNNEGFDDSGVPAELWQNSTSAIPHEVLEATAVGTVVFDWDAEAFTTVINAVDYGVDTVTATDDTAAMKKVFAAAAEVDGPVKVVLPPAMVTISETLTIPADLMLDSRGLGSIKQLDIKKPMFTGEDVERLYLRNLRFVSGSNAFVLNTTADAEILIEKCLIYQQYGCSFVFNAPAENNAAMHLERCLFVSPIQGVVSNMAYKSLEAFWVSTNARQDREAFLVNAGGDMLVDRMLGVPMPMKDHGYNHLPIIENWPFSNETRWIDNYGRLYTRFSRWGGEYYGIVPVYNFNADGTVVIDGSYTCHAFPDCKNCILYCVETPAAAIFSQFGWHWKRGVQSAVKYENEDTAPAEIWCRNFYYATDSFIAR